jgi:thiol-disulfide isomerase/thioredoxin
MAVPLFILLVGLVQALPPQAPRPATPGDCLTAAREFALNRQRTAVKVTAEVVRQIESDKVVMAQACAAQFNPSTIADSEIASLIALYGEAAQPELAKATLDRALASKTLPAGVRAEVLSQAVVTGLLEPKSDARNARLEWLVDELDRLPGDLLGLQLSAHARMNGYYRGDDIDDGIIKHSTWLIKRAATFTPEQRTQYGSTIVSAHINMAEAVAGRGDTDGAQALLTTARAKWSDIRNADRMLDPVIARYALIGTLAAPVSAPRWLNAPDNSAMAMPGAVTLLEFTAHWCGPCKESYPGVKRLLAKFGPQGFRVVLATELYGYFDLDRNLSAEVEFERDRKYFADEGLTVPVAIEDLRKPPVRGADGNYTYFDNPNDKAYEVGGIPQIHLIDKNGRIRLIMVGYDEANETYLAGLIEKLLKEK